MRWPSTIFSLSWVILCFVVGIPPVLGGKKLRLITMPVGSGDCALVIFPTGKLMMIDTGTSEMFKEVVLPFLQRHCIDHLDYMVKSHEHPDHMEGVAIMKDRGIVNAKTELWDSKTFHYEDDFTKEEVHFFIYNTKDTQFHGSDANYNSLAFRMEYKGWVYTTGGDEGLTSMRRFMTQHRDLVRAHVRKIAHHMWGPLSTPFLKLTDAHLYITPNKRAIVGMEAPWNAWDAQFLPDVVNVLRAKGRRIDDPGYAVTGIDGFIGIMVEDQHDWDYTTDQFNRRHDYMIKGWSRCPGTTVGATFLSQSVPRYMLAGDTATVSIRMTNSGDTTWSKTDFFRLLSKNPNGNTIWGIKRVMLPTNKNIKRGRDWTFKFSITAPTSPGKYNFQWQMMNEGPGGVGRVGALTPNIEIIVLASESCSCIDVCSAHCPNTATAVPNAFKPTLSPTLDPTGRPTRTPTHDPTEKPTRNPTTNPTEGPTRTPTNDPIERPTRTPTHDPTERPTIAPIISPTTYPVTNPTKSPTENPMKNPTESSTESPSTPANVPTVVPTVHLTNNPLTVPTEHPATDYTEKPITKSTLSPADNNTEFPDGSETTFSPSFRLPKTPSSMPSISQTVVTIEAPVISFPGNPTINVTYNTSIDIPIHSPTFNLNRYPTHLPSRNSTVFITESPAHVRTTSNPTKNSTEHLKTILPTKSPTLTSTNSNMPTFIPSTNSNNPTSSRSTQSATLYVPTTNDVTSTIELLENVATIKNRFP